MNRLSRETSPYLLQHADNPVYWWAWCDEAFAEAKRLDKPILLSVGYSTCHWCHVMAHESFEDEVTASYMNEHFINIKLDREERPDIDAVYMAATQALTGQGGWPMTVFLSPDAKPFYAGTYFPPRDAYGMPSFMRVLENINNVWTHEKEQAQANARILTEHIQSMTEHRPDSQAGVNISSAVNSLWGIYDDIRGGFGKAPKFPSPTTLDFLLTQPGGRDMALHTLLKMGSGGIYDQLGGGFHRYSVDEMWLVPHFEKMLYDNAQLAKTLISAYQLTKNEEYAVLAKETLEYLRREMLSPEGGFYSAQDADTGGVEGLTYTWNPAEISEVLGDEAGEFINYFGVSEAGNFLDPHKPEYGRRSVLHVPRPQPAKLKELENSKRQLLAARLGRSQPHTDKKILSSWNGLALEAFAEAARVFNDSAYLEIALRNACFIKNHLRSADGTLLHVFNGEAKVSGLLEDHALYALGLISLYKATGEMHHLSWARDLWEIVKRDFWSEQDGVFFSWSEEQKLLIRQAQAFDSAVISDNAAAALLAFWMGRYFDDHQASGIAAKVVASHSAAMQSAAGGFGGLLRVAAMLDAPQSEVVIIGTKEERRLLENVLGASYLPFATLILAEAGTDLPTLLGKDRAGAYVCINRTCRAPVSEAGQLMELLRTC